MDERKHILVAGDIMLDRYRFGSVSRISPEAPVPIFLESDETRDAPGGAANVCVNLAAIGEKVDAFSITGKDVAGNLLLSLLKKHGVGTESILQCEDVKTTQKLRYVAQNHQQILRCDSECASKPGMDRLEHLLKRLEGVNYGMILLSDYGKGFLSEELAQRLICLAKEKGIPVLADVKGNSVKKYKYADLIKPNQAELAELTGMEVKTEEQIEKAATILREKAQCAYILVTLGPRGMMLVDAEGTVCRQKTAAKEVFDVTGAGDTSFAYLAAALLGGKNIREAVAIANYAAGVQVSKMGTSVVRPNEVSRAMLKLSGSDQKLQKFDNPNFLKILEAERNNGKRIVFTNGCFDILHAGHIAYLKKAKALGGSLLVAVNSDASVKRLKGETRPVNTLSDRVAMLSALEFVDYVTVFEEDTPEKPIQCIRPDVLVKGGDYLQQEVIGANFVRQYGGEVVILPLLEGRSTTSIIQKVQGEYSFHKSDGSATET